MDQIGALNEAVTTAQRQLEVVRDTICKLIATLPDNPRIKRLSPHCFVMSSADLGNNWSPEHHDFQWQYLKIIEIIEKSEPLTVLNKLHEIVADGRIKESTYAGYGRSSCNIIKLHPDVVKNIGDALGQEVV